MNRIQKKWQQHDNRNWFKGKKRKVRKPHGKRSRRWTNTHPQIPAGDYCYRRTPEGERVVCPFWRYVPRKPPQEFGACSYIKNADWLPNGTWTLFDMTKECGTNQKWGQQYTHVHAALERGKNHHKGKRK